MRELPPLPINTTIAQGQGGRATIAPLFQEWLENARQIINRELPQSSPSVGICMAAYPQPSSATPMAAVFASYLSEHGAAVFADYAGASSDPPLADYGAAIEIPTFAEY